MNSNKITETMQQHDNVTRRDLLGFKSNETMQECDDMKGIDGDIII